MDKQDNQRYSISINYPNNLGSNNQRYSTNLNNIPMNLCISSSDQGFPTDEALARKYINVHINI